MIWEASSALVFQHQPFMLIEGKQINVYMCAKVNWTYKEYDLHGASNPIKCVATHKSISAAIQYIPINVNRLLAAKKHILLKRLAFSE